MSSTPAKAKSDRAPLLRERHKQFTHDRLLEAAVTVFATKGYAAATIDDIAAEAGVNRGTVYLHFKNKREVANDLFIGIRPSVHEEIALLDDVLAGGSRTELRDWLHRMLEWYDSHRGTILALESILLDGGFSGAGLESVYVEKMPKLLARWPESRRDELRMRLWLVTHLMSRVLIVGRVNGMLPEVSEEMIIDLIAELWIAELGVGQDELPPAPPRRRARR